MTELDEKIDKIFEPIVQQARRQEQIVRELATKIETLPGVKKTMVAQLISDGFWMNDIRMSTKWYTRVLGPEYGPCEFRTKKQIQEIRKNWNLS